MTNVVLHKSTATVNVHWFDCFVWVKDFCLQWWLFIVPEVTISLNFASVLQKTPSTSKKIYKIRGHQPAAPGKKSCNQIIGSHPKIIPATLFISTNLLRLQSQIQSVTDLFVNRLAKVFQGLKEYIFRCFSHIWNVWLPGRILLKQYSVIKHSWPFFSLSKCRPGLWIRARSSSP